MKDNLQLIALMDDAIAALETARAAQVSALHEAEAELEAHRTKSPTSSLLEAMRRNAKNFIKPLCR